MMVGDSRRRAVGLAARYSALAVASLITVTPLVYLLLVSFKQNALALGSPWQVMTGPHTLANYGEVWGTSHMSTYFLNSLVVSTATTVITVFLGSMMAYAFARFSFPGRGVLLGLVLVELMVPAIMLLIPQFLLARDIGVLDSRSGLVLFYVGANLALTTFLLIGFFRGIPVELDEAMRIDGAGAWLRYRRLILPLSRPALATTAIFCFLGSWDEYVWALTTINTPDRRTLPIGIALFSGAHTTDWGLVFAASAIALGPVLLVFLIFQRQFVNGMTVGAIKS